MIAAAIVLALAALTGLAAWLYGIHTRALTAAEARGYQRRAAEGVEAGFAAGWHTTSRGAR